MKDVDQNPNHCWVTKYFTHLNHHRTGQEGEASGGIFYPMALYRRGHFDIHFIPRFFPFAIYSPNHGCILSVGGCVNCLFLSSPHRFSFFRGDIHINKPK
jgi:hypothetical protein